MTDTTTMYADKKEIQHTTNIKNHLMSTTPLCITPQSFTPLRYAIITTI